MHKNTLTSHKHENDGEYLFIVRIGGHVPETDRDKASETEVEGGAVAALKIKRRWPFKICTIKQLIKKLRRWPFKICTIWWVRKKTSK